jgi:Ca2+-binding EF-hand superfamily protein
VIPLSNRSTNGNSLVLRNTVRKPFNMPIDLDKIRSKLPTEKTAEQKAKRIELFNGFDPNGNGYLSLAEVDKGCKDVLELPEIYENKPVMMRAFQAAKGANNAKSMSELGQHYIERSEFRLLLVYLRNYFEFWQMFNIVDSGDDRRINMEEFKSAIPMMETWGIEIDDAEMAFQEIDENGGGQILFDEFSDWAIKKALDLVEEEEPEPSDMHGSSSTPPNVTGSGSKFKASGEGSSIDWAKIRDKLPTEKTDEQKEKRKKLYEGFDPNGNGYLSLAEVHKGCRDVLALPEIYENKPVMMRAFQAAKGANNGKSKSELGQHYIERSEFRLLLVYLRNYFEFWQMFDRIDSGDDRRINMEEFKSAIPMMETWGVKIDDAEKTFQAIDTNGGGQILFDEFSDWAIKKGLDVEDDDE